MILVGLFVPDSSIIKERLHKPRADKKLEALAAALRTWRSLSQQRYYTTHCFRVGSSVFYCI